MGSMPDIPGRITEREFWDRIRRALLMVLGAIDDYLGWERTVEPRRKS